jgi:hypothetical protein
MRTNWHVTIHKPGYFEVAACVYCNKEMSLQRGIDCNFCMGTVHSECWNDCCPSDETD